MEFYVIYKGRDSLWFIGDVILSDLQGMGFYRIYSGWDFDRIYRGWYFKWFTGDGILSDGI